MHPANQLLARQQRSIVTSATFGLFAVAFLNPFAAL